ncbi:hypothetical protein HanIR_Chr16g0820551 [Helianthus annuus]|nr:hypothetical protein HanIR_Chr16g0820551 [Helianthus annuus]
MGNCIKKISVLESSGEEYSDLEAYNDIRSKSRKSEAKRVGYTERPTVKIVVTRKQLEFLVRNAKDFHISKINPKSTRHRDRYRKWQPSLATVQE